MQEEVEQDGATVGEVTYYKVVYPVKCRAAGWITTVLDYGYSESITDPAQPTAPGTLRPILDSANLPVKQPWPLDGHGRKKSS